MPCYAPLKGWYSDEVNESGKRSIVFNKKDALCPVEVIVPCGKCIGCRLERSRQWAVRCVHEASLYDENCFITLTFDERHVDLNRSLVKSDFVLFMKRLRKEFGSGIRFFHCGEYGDKLDRPHHHACLFNFDFPDKVLWSVRDGVRLYRSATLERLWPFGFCTVGDVTFDSAAYVARYVVKKMNGNVAKLHYQGREPEYCTMSRRPGIGAKWYEKFKTDVFPHGFVVIRDGKKVKVPPYYMKKYELTNPGECASLKNKQIMSARGDADSTPQRLRVREELHKLRAEQLTRGMENGIKSV